MQREDALISVLVINVDHYMTKIYIGSDLENVDQQPLQQLRPVIRVFGSTALGQRACVHIHGVRMIYAQLLSLVIYLMC